MLRKHSTAASLILGLLVSVIGCSDAPVATTFGGGAALSVSPKVLDVDALGETSRLNVVVNGGRGGATPSFSWTSLDPDVATVNGSGEVTSRANGETRIVVRNGDAADTALVRVSQKVASISIGSEPVLNLDALGITVKLEGVPQDRRGNPVPGAVTTWQSLDPAIVMVTQNGLLSSRDNGNGKVKGSSGEATDTVDVNVEQAAESLSLVPSTIAFTSLGQVETLTLNGFDKNGRPIRANGVQWSVSDESVAQVDKNGVVIAVGNGTTELQAKSGPSTATATITVNQLIDRVAIDPGSLGVYVGQELMLEAAAYDAGGSVVPGTTTTWSSASTSIASVSNGKVKGVSKGSTTVHASIQGRSAAADVNVKEVQVGDISLSVTVASLLPGQTLQLTATVHDADGTPLPNRVVTWATSNASVAAISAGLVTGVSAGSATITATSEGQSTTAAITVTVPVASVKVTPTSVALDIGETRQLSATTYDSNDNVLTGRTVTWTSSAPAVATVNSSGLVTALKVGAATILASSEGRTASSSINVTEPEPPPTTEPGVSKVAITAKVDTLDALNAKAQFTATAYDANQKVLSGVTFTWKSTNTSILTVDGNGEVTAKAVGTALIIASTTCCDHADTTSVAVWQRPATAAVTPSSGSLKKGESLGLKATIYDRLGSAIPNAPVTWTSSKTSVATVSSNGTVTAVADGTASITAASSGTSVSAAISVAASDTPPPQGILFADDFSSGDLSKNMGGSRWTGGNKATVSTLIARSGSHSLQFRYPGSTDPCKDQHSEQRFELATGVGEVWMEWYLYLPDGTEGNLGPAFVNRTVNSPDCSSATNLKVLRLWGETYSGPVDIKTGLSIWSNPDRIGPDWGATNYSIGPRKAPRHLDFVANSRGRWVQMRFYARPAKTAASSDGVIRFWVDGVLVSESTTIPMYADNGLPNYFRKGYLMGWSSAGFDKETFVYIDDLTILGSDPGWK